MTQPTKNDRWLDRLREKAENMLAAKDSESLTVSIDDVQKLVHEINVYHTELELQNQELQDARNFLEISRNRYWELFDMAPIGYFTMDVTGVIAEVNLMGAELVGADRSDIKHKPFVAFVEKPFHRDLYRFFQTTLTRKTAGPLFLKLRKQDGGAIDAQMESALIHAPEKTDSQLLVSVTDISAQKEAEAVVAKSEAKFRSLVESSADQIFLLSTDGFYLSSNDRVDHLGLDTGSQLVGRAIEDVYDPPTAALYRRKIEEVITSRKPLSFTHDICPEKERFFHIDTLFPIMENNRVSAIGGICHDITAIRKAEQEKKELELKLAQAQKMEAIGLLAGGIAHDFNNILSSVLGFTELSLESVDPASEIHENLRTIFDSSIRAKELVQQILTFSRKADHDFQPFDPVPVIRKAISFLRSTLPSTIVISQDITGDRIRINGNHIQLHQVIINIGTNAAHAMTSKKGTISFRVTQTSGENLPSDIRERAVKRSRHYLEIEITDTGAGIPETILDKIFDPYFTTKAVDKGTGLGLAVVMGIVKGHGGHIQVRSLPGKGTVFTISVPCINTDAAAGRWVPKVKKSDDSLVTRDKTVVVVDDEASIRKMVIAALRKLGCEAIPFANGEDALAYLQSHAPEIDLVITDKTMPRVTGDELTKAVKEIRPDLPVVISSGYNSPGGVENVMTIADAFLQKPFSREELKAAMSAAFEKASAGRRTD